MITRTASSSARRTRASRRHRRPRHTSRWRTCAKPTVARSSRPSPSMTTMMTRSRTRGPRRSTACTSSTTCTTAPWRLTQATSQCRSSSARSNSTSPRSARRRRLHLHRRRRIAMRSARSSRTSLRPARHRRRAMRSARLKKSSRHRRRRAIVNETLWLAPMSASRSRQSTRATTVARTDAATRRTTAVSLHCGDNTMIMIHALTDCGVMPR